MQIFTVHRQTVRPIYEIRPAAWLRVPAWAPGPAANDWVGEAAQRRLPPGLIPARVGRQCLATVDRQIEGSKPSHRFRWCI
jgi:hypothetical protein